MAPRASISPRSPGRSLSDIFDVFLCPSCTNWRIATPSRRGISSIRQTTTSNHTTTSPAAHRSSRARLRVPPIVSSALRNPTGRASITTSAATNAINAPSAIPAKLRALHAALDQLQRTAPEYVNLSQLSLALRGLESGDAGVTRIAILGFNSGEEKARRLARLLLVDPLKSRGEEWEDRLAAGGAAGGVVAGSSGAVLVRYGEGPGSSAVVTGGRNNMYEEVEVAAPLLRRHNIELLISTLSSDVAVAADGASSAAEADRPSDAILIPNLEAGRAGRVTMVRYPVNKAIVLGTGLEDCIRIGTFVAGEMATEERRGLITFAVDLQGLTGQQMRLDSTVYGVTAVDLAAAERAVTEMRRSTDNVTNYEREWLHSGLPSLRQWLLNNVPASDTVGNPALKPALQHLIGHLLTSTSTALNASALSAAPATTPSDTHLATVSALEEALATWSGNAHSELRDQLDEAFASRNWAKIAWWKLLWRVDDVAMVSEEVLERRWLLRAEKGALWLLGRLEQAAILPPTPSPAVLPPPSDTPTEVTSAVETGVPPQDMLSSSSSSSPSRAPVPLSVDSIARARTVLEEDTVPQLQAAAQRLLLEALSTASLTSSLAALLWLSSSFSVFEAGGVAAFGLVWALRRLQRRWEGKRELWAGEVREEGRVCLRDVERSIGAVLEEAKGVKVPEEQGWVVRRDAREAVGKVREELEKLKG